MKRQKKIESFRESDEKTGIHGDHIYLGYNGYAKDLLSEDLYSELKTFFGN